MIDPLRITSKSGAAETDVTYYGTRLSTVVLISRKTRVATFIERDAWILNDDNKVIPGHPSDDRRFIFPLS
jgi:uncharacterized protein with NRDE domain